MTQHLTPTGSRARVARREDALKLTICFSTVLILVLGWCRPREPHTGVAPESFWAQKLCWPAMYNGVVAGDSRVYRGVSPAAMQEILPAWRIANFGFSAASLSRAYLTAAERLLDPSSPEPFIVIGVTPHALTKEAFKNNGFIDWKNKPMAELYQLVHTGKLLEFFAPYKPSMLLGGKERTQQRYEEIYYPDGWIASRRIPENPSAAMKRYQKVLTDNPISEEAVEDLLTMVRVWSNHGIRVIGFRPPASSDVAALEDQLTGFNEMAFATQFEEHGGIWLFFPAGAYHSYDGSHLRADAARQLSYDLAHRLSLVMHRTSLMDRAQEISDLPASG